MCKVMLCSRKCGSEACRVGRVCVCGGSSAEISAALAQTFFAFAPASLSPSTHVALSEYHRVIERGCGLQVTARGNGKGSLPPPGGELFRHGRKKVIPTGSIHTFYAISYPAIVDQASSDMHAHHQHRLLSPAVFVFSKCSEEQVNCQKEG